MQLRFRMLWSGSGTRPHMRTFLAPFLQLVVAARSGRRDFVWRALPMILDSTAYGAGVVGAAAMSVAEAARRRVGVHVDLEMLAGTQLGLPPGRTAWLLGLATPWAIGGLLAQGYGIIRSASDAGEDEHRRLDRTASRRRRWRGPCRHAACPSADPRPHRCTRRLHAAQRQERSHPLPLHACPVRRDRHSTYSSPASPLRLGGRCAEARKHVGSSTSASHLNC